MCTSSARRSAAAKPTSKSARSRTPSSPFGSASNIARRSAGESGAFARRRLPRRARMPASTSRTAGSFEGKATRAARWRSTIAAIATSSELGASPSASRCARSRVRSMRVHCSRVHRMRCRTSNVFRKVCRNEQHARRDDDVFDIDEAQHRANVTSCGAEFGLAKNRRATGACSNE